MFCTRCTPNKTAIDISSITAKDWQSDTMGLKPETIIIMRPITNRARKPMASIAEFFFFVKTQRPAMHEKTPMSELRMKVGVIGEGVAAKKLRAKLIIISTKPKTIIK